MSDIAAEYTATPTAVPNEAHRTVNESHDEDHTDGEWRPRAQRVAIATFGCRLNRAESEHMAQALRRQGYDVTLSDGTDEPVDLWVVNGCTVTEQADHDAERFIRRVGVARPQARVAVVGCGAAHHGAAWTRFDNVHWVLGTTEKQHLVDYLAQSAATMAPPAAGVPTSASIVAVEGHRATRPGLVIAEPVARASRARTALKVQDGCNYRCTFCVIPAVRGRSRSYDLPTLKQQLGELVDAGVPEVVLTGVHLGLWGRDLAPRLSFSALVEALGRRAAGTRTRIRLGSLDPHEVDATLVDQFARDPYGHHLCRFVHLAVQSADDGVLRRMRRAHRYDDLVRWTDALALAVPAVRLTADVIVGYPDETEAEFATTRENLAKLPLAGLHVFPYSPRSGTQAAAIPDRVGRDARRARAAMLRDLGQQLARRFAEAQKGQTALAVVHRRRGDTGRLVGHTDHGLRVEFTGPDAWLGGRVAVRLGTLRDANRPERGLLAEALDPT